MDDSKRKEILNGAARAILFLKAHPEVKLPAQLNGYGAPVTWSVWLTGDAKDQKTNLRLATRALGKVKKIATESAFGVTHEFGPEFIFKVAADRGQTCDRIVTGTRKVMKTVEVTPAVYDTVEVTEDIVDWYCPPILPDDK